MKKKATRKATQTKKSVSKTAKKTTAQAKKSATKKADSTKSSKLKTYAKKYGSDIRKAYDIGYARGWEDAYNVPKRVGAKTVAAHGFKKGLKQRPKADKYTKQYNRKG